MAFLTYVAGKPAPLVPPPMHAILRVVAYGANTIYLGITPDTFGDPTGGAGLLWTGTNPGTRAVIPTDAFGVPSAFVGAPDRAEGYAVEVGAGGGFDEVRFHAYTGAWATPGTAFAGWADQSDPVVWRGADSTHADAAALAVDHAAGGQAAIYTVTYSGGTPSFSTLSTTLPGGYPERSFAFRARLAGSVGNWWGAGVSRYGTSGFRDSIWIAQFVGSPGTVYGGPSSSENSAGVCLWVESSSNVWVGGYLDLGSGVDSAGQRPYLWHVSSGTVTPTALTGLMPINSPGAIQGVHGLSSSDVWAVGQIIDQTVTPNVQRILIFHYNGSAWSAVSGLSTLVPPVASVQQVLYDVYAYASNDVWAVGTEGYQSGVSDGTLLALHYDGSSWSRVTITG
jgi:hypothetical protein